MNHLLIDANYLCHRAWHTTGALKHKGLATGVAFGLLRDLDTFKGLFAHERIVLAFDSESSLRRMIYPQYKAGRTHDPILEEQIQNLRDDLLPGLGYSNVFCELGYEADDILAACAEQVTYPDTAIIISADKDLLQCLRKGVTCYNPSQKKTTDAVEFRSVWQLDPLQWPCVKSLAGCSTDNVAGIEGVGEATAAAWFSGSLKPGKKYDKILQNLHISNQNMPLVKLPYPGLKLPEIREDGCTETKKEAALQSLGIGEKRPKNLKKQFSGYNL